ncbi:MAG: aspartate carbamoyltransferase catalytic subunit [Alphaproteobacteria bacterium]
MSSFSDLKLSVPHLFGIEKLPLEDIKSILSLAVHYADKKNISTLPRRFVMINAFFENSTRTRTSFEMAAKRLGIEVINFSAKGSSLEKGETDLDTIKTLAALKPDAFVVRHSDNGASETFAEYFSCPVVNAGDGANEHPTQALLDALTIQQKKGQIEGQNIVICGDILHSRVTFSNIHLLSKMGANVRLCSPPEWKPAVALSYPNVTFFDNFEKALEGADVVMMLRVQRERMKGEEIANLYDYIEKYGLTVERLKHAKPDVIVMHPGPVNRGIEMVGEIVDDPRVSMIDTQVANGVAVRAAVLDLLTRG